MMLYDVSSLMGFRAISFGSKKSFGIFWHPKGFRIFGIQKVFVSLASKRFSYLLDPKGFRIFAIFWREGFSPHANWRENGLHEGISTTSLKSTTTTNDGDDEFSQHGALRTPRA
jgi:hypothetical protein